MADYYNKTSTERFNDYKAAVDKEIATNLRNKNYPKQSDDTRYSNFRNQINNIFKQDRINRANKTKSIDESIDAQHDATIKKIDKDSVDALTKECEDIRKDVTKADSTDPLASSANALASNANAFKRNSTLTDNIKNFNNRFNSDGTAKW